MNVNGEIAVDDDVIIKEEIECSAEANDRTNDDFEEQSPLMRDFNACIKAVEVYATEHRGRRVSILAGMANLLKGLLQGRIQEPTDMLMETYEEISYSDPHTLALANFASALVDAVQELSLSKAAIRRRNTGSTCPECGKYVENILVHQARHHTTYLLNKPKQYFCTFCGDGFKRHSYYQIHQKECSASKAVGHANLAVPVNCPMCRKPFRSANTLCNHWTNTHANFSPMEIFGCSACRTRYKTSYLLSAHWAQRNCGGMLRIPVDATMKNVPTNDQKNAEAPVDEQLLRCINGLFQPPQQETPQAQRMQKLSAAFNQRKLGHLDEPQKHVPLDEPLPSTSAVPPSASRAVQHSTEFKDPDEWSDMGKSTVMKENFYQCRFCGEVYKRLKFFSDHNLACEMKFSNLRERALLTPVACPLCSAHFSNSHELSKHAAKDHKEFDFKMFKCNICCTGYQSVAHLKIHWNSKNCIGLAEVASRAEGMQYLQHPKSEKQPSEDEDVAKRRRVEPAAVATAHQQTTSRRVENSLIMYSACMYTAVTCPLCSTRFPSFFSYSTHIRISHPWYPGPAFGCRGCNSTYMLAKNLEDHAKDMEADGRDRCRKRGCIFDYDRIMHYIKRPDMADRIMADERIHQDPSPMVFRIRTILTNSRKWREQHGGVASSSYLPVDNDEPEKKIKVEPVEAEEEHGVTIRCEAVEVIKEEEPDEAIEDNKDDVSAYCQAPSGSRRKQPTIIARAPRPKRKATS